MRDPREVQTAHDVLHAIIAQEVFLELRPEEHSALHLVHDALSWVLCGPCGDSFEQNLALVKAELMKRGYMLVER